MDRWKSLNFDGSNWRVSTQAATCVAVAFLLFDALLMRRVWILDGFAFALVSSVINSQYSMIAIVAALSRRNLPLRFACVLLATYVCLELVMRTLLASGVQTLSWYWAIWFIVLAIGTMTILGFCQRVASSQHRGSFRRSVLLSFDLRLMIELTFVCACLFAAAKFGKNHWGWEYDPTFHSWYLLSMSYGLCDAVVTSLVVLAAFQSGWKTPIAIVCSAILLSLAGYIAILFVLTEDLDVDRTLIVELSTFAIVPRLLVAVTLFVCRRPFPRLDS